MSKNVLILSTPTCIKCKMIIPQVEKLLDENNIPYAKGNALEEFRDLVVALNVMSVPTIIVYENTPEKPDKVFSGDFNLKDFRDYILV